MRHIRGVVHLRAQLLDAVGERAVVLERQARVEAELGVALSQLLAQAAPAPGGRVQRTRA